MPSFLGSNFLLFLPFTQDRSSENRYEVGHEVLWVLRDCLSPEILLARTLLSAPNQDARPSAN